MFRIFLFILLFTGSIARSQNPSISGIVNTYRKVIAIDSAKGYVRLMDASNLTQFIGNAVMLIQMKGATIDQSNSGSFGNITQIGQAGNFEIGKMCGQIGDTIIFTNKLQNFYDASGQVQLVFIPKFSDVTISGPVKAGSWDPASGTGGILALDASGTITLNADITADSAGFKGGGLLNNTIDCNSFFPATNYYYNAAGNGVGGNGAKKGEGIAAYISGKEYGKGKQANGGGGGNNANNGGGGGGNYGTGGNGGYKASGCTERHPGLGGLTLSTSGYSSPATKIFMGGGGGAGHENNNVATPGGNGGGIVFIRCITLVSNGHMITSNGGVPYNPSNVTDPYSADSDGGGGGGAGGTIMLQTNSYSGNLILEGKGGKGSDSEAAGTSFCTGPGGGGGGGVIWLSGSSLPLNTSYSVAGGDNGVVRTSCVNSANGATPGVSGLFTTGFILPALNDTSPVCKAVLPVKVIQSFNGTIVQDKIVFKGELTDPGMIINSELQRSPDGINFVPVQNLPDNSTITYLFSDDHREDNQFYRMVVTLRSGSVEYSAVIPVKGDPAKWIDIKLFPNPVTDILNIQVRNKRQTNIRMVIMDVTGRTFSNTSYQLQPGSQVERINVQILAPGKYIMRVVSQDFLINKTFTKL